MWRVIADGWLYSGWVVGASRIRAVDPGWPLAGSRLHHSVGAWPLVIDDSTRVAAATPGRSLELVARGWPMGEAKVVITLEEMGRRMPGDHCRGRHPRPGEAGAQGSCGILPSTCGTVKRCAGWN